MWVADTNKHLRPYPPETPTDPIRSFLSMRASQISSSWVGDGEHIPGVLVFFPLLFLFSPFCILRILCFLSCDSLWPLPYSEEECMIRRRAILWVLSEQSGSHKTYSILTLIPHRRLYYAVHDCRISWRHTRRVETMSVEIERDLRDQCVTTGERQRNSFTGSSGWDGTWFISSPTYSSFVVMVFDRSVESLVLGLMPVRKNGLAHSRLMTNSGCSWGFLPT